MEVRRGEELELLRNRDAVAYVTIEGYGLAAVDVNHFYGEIEDADGDGQPDYRGSNIQSEVLRYHSNFELPESAQLCDPNAIATPFHPLELALLAGRTNDAPWTLPVLVHPYGVALLEAQRNLPVELTLTAGQCGTDTGRMSGMAVAERYPVRLVDAAGAPAGEQERDYVVMTNTLGWVLVVDVTERAVPKVVAKTVLPAPAAAVTVDRANRQLLVSAYGEGIYVVDFDGPFSNVEIDVAQAAMIDEDLDGRDDRVLEQIEVLDDQGVAINVNRPVELWADLGLAWIGGLRDLGSTGTRGLAGLALAPPKLRIVAEHQGTLREVSRIAPFGVPTAKEGAAADSPSYPGLVRIEASLPPSLADASGEIRVDLVGLGPGGLEIRGAGDPSQIADLPPASFRGADGLVLKRQSADLWEEGSSVFVSEPVVVLADLRASHHYDMSTQEKEASAAAQSEPLCVRCDLVAEGVYETDAQGAVNPAHVHREILSGHQLGVLLPTALRTQLEAVYDKTLVAQAEIAVPSVPWDLSPALRQEPTLNPSMGTGDVVPGTLLHSGEMTLTATDVAIPGRGFPFVFTRTYRSQTLGNGPLGPGWDHNYRMRLRKLPNGDVEYFDGRGRRELFRRNHDETYEAPAGRFVSLERGADGWVLVDPRRNRVHFDRFGRLVAIADAIKESETTGNEIRFFYDSISRLVRVNDTLDRDVYLDYDASGRLTKITDFTGREFDYAYDTSGRLQEFRTPEVETVGGTAPEALTTSYVYETPAAGDLTYKLVQRDNLASVTDPKGQTWLQLTYADADGDGRSDELTQQDWGAGAVGLTYEFTTRLTTVNDRRSNVCKYNFNEAGQTTRIEDPATAVGTFNYDAEGLMIERVEPLGRRTTYTYPADGADRRSRGNLLETSVTADSRGANGSSPALVTQMQYHDLTNLPTRVTDPRAVVTATERLESGLASRVTRAEGAAEASTITYTYNEFGQMTETVNPNGHRTTYAYFTDGPSRGYQREVVDDPDNLALKNQFETDARGNVTAVIDPRSVRHERAYNALDWQTEVRRAISASSDGAPALGYTQTSKYDKNGNLAESEIPFGAGSQHTSVKYTYGVLDELLEVKRQIQPGDAETLWNVEQTEYDANLNMTRITDPEGHLIEYDYDERNLVTTARSGMGTGALAAPIVEIFSYNLERQQTSRIDGRGNVWQSAYDGYGRPQEYRDPLGNRTITTYDNNGNVLAQERRANDDTLLSRSSSTYDLLNRRTASKPSLWNDAPAGARDLVNQFAYDPASNIEKVIDPLGRTTEYRYDTADRLVEVIDPALNRQLMTLDAAGNVTVSQTVELDPIGGSVTVSATSTYDALNRRVTQTDDLQNTYQTFYDARSQVTQTTDPEGYSTQLTYDGLNRMTRELRPEGIEVTRSYDRDSNLTLYQDALGNQTTYAYDAAHRQASVTYPDSNQESFSYDAAHNLTRHVDQRGTAVDQTYDLANRLTSRTVTPALGETLVGPLAETYAWDGLNRLNRAQSGDVVSELRYDSLSRLLSDRTNGREITHQYDDASNPTLKTYPSSYQVAASFDSLDRPTSFSEVGAGTLAGYAYRGPLLVQEKTLGNGISGSTTFDASRRPLQQTFIAADGLTVFEESLSWSPRSLKAAQSRGDWNGVGLSLGYDGAGRVTHVARVPDPLAGAPNNSVPDPLGLVGQPESFQFSYDAAQNLVSRTEIHDGVPGVTDLPNDASGRNRPGSISGSPLLWDANGNLVSKGDLDFEYDYRNRLTRVTDAAASEVAAYAYDAFNRRVAKTVGATTTETVWDDWRAIEDYENGALKSRRTYGIGLDEMIRMENDLNGDGVPEQSYVPLYDSTGNLVVMTGPDGKSVERYLYSPYGEQTIWVDSTPPEIEQVRVTGGEIWVEVSEEVLESELAAAVDQDLLRLVRTDTSAILPISVSQPVQDGGQARRRLVISPTTAPASGTEVRLIFEPEALADLFLNKPISAVEYTFDWPAAGLVISDNVPPRVELVVVRNGIIEIELSEETDPVSAAAEILIGGMTRTWTLQLDHYTLAADTALAAGTYELRITTGTLDLNGLGLVAEFSQVITIAPAIPEAIVFRRPDLRVIAETSIHNYFSFHGLAVDAETGLVYARNRYYDPQTARFIAMDPLGFVDGPNMHQFTLNDPINMRDSLGLTARSDIGKRSLFYTWNFGWVDTSHASGKYPELEFAWRRLQSAYPGEEIWFSLGMQQGVPGKFTHRQSIMQFKIKAALTVGDRKRQLLHAFQLISEDFEDLQGEGFQGSQALTTIYGAFKGEQQKIASSRSTEDLFSDLLTFYSVVESLPLGDLLRNFGGEIDPAEREEFSYLVWDYLVRPRQHGAQGWSPVLLDPDSIPSIDEVMRGMDMNPHTEGYYEVRQRLSDDLARLRTLVEKYRTRFGDSGLPQLMGLSPLAEGVSVEGTIRQD